MPESDFKADHWARTKDKVTILSQLLLNEQQLMGYRMAWLVMSQSFLFGAVIFGDAPGAGETTRLALKLVTLLGLFISLSAALGVAAALRMVHILHHHLELFDGVLGLQRLGPRRESSWTTWAGNAPAIVLPAWFAGSWLVLLRTVWDVPISQSATLYGALAVVAVLIRVSIQLVYRPRPLGSANTPSAVISDASE
jgi:hypothetical protein